MVMLLWASMPLLAQRPAQLGIYSSSAPNPFIKRVWISQDKNTGQKYISIYAPCGKGTCYWGKFIIKRDPDLYERVRWRQNHAWLPYYETFTIDQGFVKRTVDILPHVSIKDHIRIVIRSDYKDPKRTDREDKTTLKLQ